MKQKKSRFHTPFQVFFPTFAFARSQQGPTWHSGTEKLLLIRNNMKTISPTILFMTLAIIGLIFPSTAEAQSSSPGTINAFSRITDRFRIFGKNVKECRVNDDKVTRYADKDTLTFYGRKPVWVFSSRLGGPFIFSGNCEYRQETFNGRSTKGTHVLTREIFAFKNNEGCVYIRPKGNDGIVAPCLQLFAHGFRYAYNVYHAEKYNPKTRKWEYASIWVDNANADPVLNFLKSHFAK